MSRNLVDYIKRQEETLLRSDDPEQTRQDMQDRLVELADCPGYGPADAVPYQIKALQDVLDRYDTLIAPIAPADDLPAYDLRADLDRISDPADAPCPVGTVGGLYRYTWEQWLHAYKKNGGPSKCKERNRPGVEVYASDSWVYYLHAGRVYNARKGSTRDDNLRAYLGTDQESEIVRLEQMMAHTPAAGSDSVLTLLESLGLAALYRAYQDAPVLGTLGDLRATQRRAVSILIRYGFDQPGAWNTLGVWELNDYMSRRR